MSFIEAQFSALEIDRVEDYVRFRHTRALDSGTPNHLN